MSDDDVFRTHNYMLYTSWRLVLDGSALRPRAVLISSMFQANRAYFCSTEKKFQSETASGLSNTARLERELELIAVFSPAGRAF